MKERYARQECPEALLFEVRTLDSRYIVEATGEPYWMWSATRAFLVCEYREVWPNHACGTNAQFLLILSQAHSLTLAAMEWKAQRPPKIKPSMVWR